MKHVIWSNFNIDVADWEDFLEEEYPDITDEYEQYRLCCDMNNEYLYYERLNLDIRLDNEIVVIGDIGRWNGRVMGYKIIESGNIKDCLYDNTCDYVEWYVDEYKDLCFRGAHHDGNNYYTYRVFKEISYEQKENFLDKLYNGTATKKDINRYTKRIGDYICGVYGW